VGEGGRHILYKAPWYGVEVTDRFFASSKTCSGCGAKKANLDLSTLVYVCAHCDLVVNSHYHVRHPPWRVLAQGRGHPTVR
jgi:putative transposase